MTLTIERIRRLLDRMPADQPPRGRKPNWGGERENAYHLAAVLGHQVDVRCQSCDADVYDLLLDAVKADIPSHSVVEQR